MKQPIKRYYSVNELAQLLGQSRIAVFKKIKAGRIPAAKVGRAYVIKGSDIAGLVGNEVGAAGRKIIDVAVKKVVREYAETLRLLGAE